MQSIAFFDVFNFFNFISQRLGLIVVLILLVIIVSAIVYAILEAKAAKIDSSDVYSAGVLKKGEEIVEHTMCRLDTTKKNIRGQKQKDSLSGVIVITNKRLLFVRKPITSSGLDILFHCPYGDILSVSTKGSLIRKITVNYQFTDNIKSAVFWDLKDIESFAEKLNLIKNSFVEDKSIEAKRVIIEEAPKDKATEILQKRLARGEITLEEFHEKVQRT